MSKCLYCDFYSNDGNPVEMEYGTSHYPEWDLDKSKEKVEGFYASKSIPSTDGMLKDSEGYAHDNVTLIKSNVGYFMKNSIEEYDGWPIFNYSNINYCPKCGRKLSEDITELSTPTPDEIRDAKILKLKMKNSELSDKLRRQKLLNKINVETLDEFLEQIDEIASGMTKKSFNNVDALKAFKKIVAISRGED